MEKGRRKRLSQVVFSRLLIIACISAVGLFALLSFIFLNLTRQQVHQQTAEEVEDIESDVSRFISDTINIPVGFRTLCRGKQEDGIGRLPADREQVWRNIRQLSRHVHRSNDQRRGNRAGTGALLQL